VDVERDEGGKGKDERRESVLARREASRDSSAVEQMQETTHRRQEDGHGPARYARRPLEALPRRPQLGLCDPGELRDGVLEPGRVGPVSEEGLFLKAMAGGCGRAAEESVIVELEEGGNDEGEGGRTDFERDDVDALGGMVRD